MNKPATQHPAPQGAGIVHATMPSMVRAATINPSTFDKAARTVEVVWTTGAIVPRYDWRNDRAYDEELVVSADAIDLSRMNAGASVLNTHDQYSLESVIGVVERAWVDGSKGRAIVRLSERPELAGLVADIESGVIRHISAGYSIQAMEMVSPEARTDGGARWLYRATRWTPAEISFVPVPADAGSGTRSQPSQGESPCEITTRAAAHQPEETRMSQDTTGGAAPTPATTPAASAADLTAQTVQRAADISELCARHAVPELAAELIRSGADLAAAQAKVLDKIAARDAAAGGHRNVQVQTVTDEFEVRMQGIAEAVQSRLDPKATLTDNGRRFRGATLLEMGRSYLESRGVRTEGMDKMTLAHTMMATRTAPVGSWNLTTDFPALLANVANKRLRDAYMEDPGTYTEWARRAPNAQDFKSISVVQLSGAPDLAALNEEGEYTYGTMTDAATGYQLSTFGKIVALTRQAIVNDDLRGFDRLITAFGYAARRKENQLVYAQLQAAGNYSLANGNLGAAALSYEALSAMRTAMRKQTGLAGEKLNLSAAFVIVPPELEGLIYQLTSPNYVPATQSATSEFRTGGRTAVTPVVEAILSDTSTTAWYGVASSGQVDTVEYCYLDGAEGPVTESKAGWEIDGMEMKCRLDFGCKAIDHRGLYKSVPAA